MWLPATCLTPFTFLPLIPERGPKINKVRKKYPVLSRDKQHNRLAVSFVHVQLLARRLALSFCFLTTISSAVQYSERNIWMGSRFFWLRSLRQLAKASVYYDESGCLRRTRALSMGLNNQTPSMWQMREAKQLKRPACSRNPLSAPRSDRFGWP